MYFPGWSGPNPAALRVQYHSEPRRFYLHCFRYYVSYYCPDYFYNANHHLTYIPSTPRLEFGFGHAGVDILPLLRGNAPPRKSWLRLLRDQPTPVPVEPFDRTPPMVIVPPRQYELHVGRLV